MQIRILIEVEFNKINIDGKEWKEEARADWTHIVNYCQIEQIESRWKEIRKQELEGTKSQQIPNQI